MIKLLTKETIDKIAAGEVVERPENVAKELIENALDSGAGSISVEVRGGGLELIRVTDNGSGIAKEDLPNAFLRHATSKLEKAEDLLHIHTMGFRGEALSSIAGVSRVEMITKRPADLTGFRYLIEGGQEKELREVGIPSGTTIIVRDLFFNIPVRRQFLKSPKTEGAYVRDVVEKAALAHPEVSFSFLCDGRQLFHTTGSGKLKDVIYTVYGRETLEQLLPIAYCSDNGMVRGFVSKPSFSRNRRDSEIFFVNDRFVKSAIIERAVESAYEGYLMQHKFPFVVLSVDVEPEKVDVNIHPKKTEVRFSEDEQVFDLLYEGIKFTLSHREHIVDALKRSEKQPQEKQIHREPFETSHQQPVTSPAQPAADTGRNFSAAQEVLSDKAAAAALREERAGWGRSLPAVQEKKPELLPGAKEKSPGLLPETKGNKPELLPETKGDKPELLPETQASGAESLPGTQTGNSRQAPDALKESSGQFFSPGCMAEKEEYEQLKFLDPKAQPCYRYLGQLFETYCLIEYDSALYIIDQHAAHEKVNYERLTEKIRRQEVTSQNILPVLLSLPARLSCLLEDHLAEFAAAGFEIESVGERDFAVRSIPAYLPELNEKQLLMEMIESLEDVKPGLDQEKLREKIASMSCKAAVKGNMRLSEPEIKELIRQLLSLKDPYHCPHGRPVMVKFSKAELDRMFKRIV